jgi:hypothetical protein
MLPLTVTRLCLDGVRVRELPGGDLVTAVHDALEVGPVVLLGPFGSGKTHLVHHLAETDACTVVPLRALDPDRPLADALVHVIGRSRLEAAQAGDHPLLLDGLDEAAWPPDTLQARFDEIRATVGPRWVVTSRPGFFRTGRTHAADQIDSLTDGLPTLHIDPLPVALVREHLLEAGGRAMVESVDGLTDLATSPLLLHVVLSAVPHIHLDRRLDAWGLFDAWIRRSLWTGPDHDDVVERLVALAWEVCVQHGFRPTALRFDADLVAAFRIPPPLRSALMVTDLDGSWRFGHRSVLEFLVAGHLAPRLAANQGHGPDELTGFLLSEATRAFLVGRVGRMPVRFEDRRVRIPRGNFVAGGDHPDARPLRIAHLARPVWLAREPVSAGDYADWFARDPDHREDVHYLSHWGPERTCPADRRAEPVYNLWPSDCDRFAAEAGARLPTADEWEKAVRGIDGRRWPWGDHWRVGHAVTAEIGVQRPLPIRAFGCHGDALLYSAVGGVFETTSSNWRGRQDRGRVVMGGCFTHPRRAAHPDRRLSHRLSGNLKCGLRLAWEAE